MPLFYRVSEIFLTPVKSPHDISPVKVYLANFSTPDTRARDQKRKSIWGGASSSVEGSFLSQIGCLPLEDFLEGK